MVNVMVYHGVLKQVNHGKCHGIPWGFETGKPW